MRALLAGGLLLAAAVVLAGEVLPEPVAAQQTSPPTTTPPTTSPPQTAPPKTAPPTTAPPQTSPPATSRPAAGEQPKPAPPETTRPATGKPMGPQPPKTGDIAPKPVGPGAEVSGQVTDADGKIIPSAAVRLVGLTSVQTAMSDVKGRFVFRNIVPGEYVVTARKRGYYDAAYGKRRPNGEALPVHLAATQAMSDLKIEMFRSSVITGSILDEGSEPVVGARVVAMRRVFVDGEWSYVAAASDTTDDQGIYRVFGLEPGEYVVATPTTQATGAVPATRADVGGLPYTERPLAYPTLFYPASRYLLLAMPLRLEPGEVRHAINFQWSPVSARTVTGRLLGPADAVSDQVVRLVTIDSREAGTGYEAAVTISAQDGTFGFERIPAGEYRVEAGGSFGTQRVVDLTPDVGSAASANDLYWGRTAINVTDEDVEHVALLMHAGVPIAGVFEVSAAADAGTFDPTHISVSLIPAKSGQSRVTKPRVSSDGHFETKPLVPGEYYVRLGGLPAGWYVSRITHDGRDLIDAPLDLHEDNAADIRIELTDRPTTIIGSVRDSRTLPASGATVVVMPAGIRQWSANRVRQTRASTNGQFAIAGLPPGDYLIVAFDDAIAEGWQDNAVLSQLRTLATKVSLREDASPTVTLRLSTIRR